MGSIHTPSRKSRPRIRANRSRNRAMNRKMKMETMMKYFMASALVLRKSSPLNSARKKGSAARRYMEVKSVITTPSLMTAP